MSKRLLQLLLIGSLSVYLVGCASLVKVKDDHDLATGAYYFEHGYYKHAMRYLLPPACDGNPKAQYAVGYMYYYGYGVAQDTDVGYFWIDKAARNHDPKAIEAEALILAERNTAVPTKRTYRRYLR